MHRQMITYRTKARASRYYGIYPDAVMRLEDYGRDGRAFTLVTNRPFRPNTPEIGRLRSASNRDLR